MIVAGGRISAIALSISLMASPIATPGFRSNDIVTAGNWPRWLIESGPTVGRNVATLLSGTSDPLRRAHIEQRQDRSIGLVARLQLHHDPVLIGRCVDRRHLALPVAVVQRVLISCAETPSADALLRSISTVTCGLAIMQVAGHTDQRREGLQASPRFSAPHMIQLGRVGALQRV
jgi:hypothetical protein